MKNSINSISAVLFCSLLAMMLVLPFQARTQTPEVRKVTGVQSMDEPSLRPMIPVCETEQHLLEKYSSYTLEAQVAEFFKEDSMFECTGVRGTRRLSGTRAVLRSILSEKRDEVFPELIKVIKKEKGEKSAMAIEIIQYADDKILREYRNLFIQKSASEHSAERNRSLYILQRIRDEHVEKKIVERWNAMSKRDVENLTETYSLRSFFELMMYGVKDSDLVEESILLTLREKKLNATGLSEFLRVLSSFVRLDHNAEIDQEVAEILWKTKGEDVANLSAEVLSESRTVESRDALIQGLDFKDEMKRAQVVHHLLSRYDFKIDQDTVLLKRILSDDSPTVIDYAYSPLIWKKPNASQSAFIVKCLLSELNQEKVSVPFKAYLMMNFYLNLDKAQRESLKLENPIFVLNAIEAVLYSSQYNRASFITSKKIYEKVYGESEMGITYIELWRTLLLK